MIGNADNTHDHGGYKVSELCVKAKYDSFKEEIENYSNFSKEQYESAKTKTNKFMQSEEMRKMTAKYTYVRRKQMFLHYDISFGDLLLFGHILALILYTDYSKLCTVFSSTFRQMHNFETLKSVKTRNALFYWMSRRLRELGELFGQCRYYLSNNQQFGPFYCGVNKAMIIPSFNHGIGNFIEMISISGL